MLATDNREYTHTSCIKEREGRKSPQFIYKYHALKFAHTHGFQCRFFAQLTTHSKINTNN